MADLTQYLINDEAKSKIEKAQSAQAQLARIEAWPVETVEDQTTVKQLLGMVQSRLADIEELRTSITKPLLETKRRVDSLFSALAAPYENTKGILKTKLEAVALAQAALIVAAREKAIAGEIVEAVPETAVSAQWEWTYEIVDVHSIPREYLAPNHAAIKMYMAAYRKSDTIEGVAGICFLRKPKVVARR